MYCIVSCRKTNPLMKVNSANGCMGSCSGSKAYLAYAELPNRVLDFQHTVTPQDQQGKGVAKVLVKEGLKYASENKFQVKPSCSYVAKYLEGDQSTNAEKELDIRHASKM